MTQAYAPVYLGRQITIKTLRDYILDANLTEEDTIVMSSVDFEEIALEFKRTYQDELPWPYLLLGVLIKGDVKDKLRQGAISVVFDDTESVRINPDEVFNPDRIIYQCVTCDRLVGLGGEELDPVEHKRNKTYFKKFGDRANITLEECNSCREDWERMKAEYRTKKREIDYASIEGKELMNLSEEDFKNIGLSKGTTSEFEIIYSCNSPRSGKIYFTPNENSYSLRGFRLKEYEEILSTEQLIEAVRNWRKD